MDTTDPATALSLPKYYQVTLAHKPHEIPTDEAVMPQRIALEPDFA